ncbi:transposable element gene [Prunus dulcis]|uniref:Transposable element protein n=1 Tax=Prunus dulcis TaxID=3755 RepID=A0A4Y1RGR0_PRUDU|nr:transposable element gene [Prunus dulcis]
MEKVPSHMHHACSIGGGMDTFDGVSESAEGGVGVGEVRNNVVDSDPSNNNNAVVTQIGKRRRKLTSAVWTQFEILPIDENNEQRAKCMKCGQKYLCDSRYGTGNLKRHIESCVKTDTRDIGQLLLSKSDGAILTRSSKFDPMKFRELLVMAIIMHDLPFQFVEYAGIRQLFNYVCADIKLVSRNTAKADVLSLYNREKSKLKDILGSVPGRVCLTSDLWTSITTDDTLRKAKVDSDSFMKSMATQMMEKFDKYWKEYSLILAIAVILDPRYKIQFIEFCYKRLYGYNSEEMTKCLKWCSSHVDDMVSKECLDVMKEFDNFESEEFTTSTQKTQLQLYLDEPKIDRKTKLNVLDFWKVNQFRYPELSILARDLLSIPISTVASESAFSVGGRVLDQYRSALKPENVEALVCTRDWIFGEENCTLAPNLEELTEDISKMEINATNSAGGSNTL